MDLEGMFHNFMRAIVAFVISRVRYGAVGRFTAWQGHWDPTRCRVMRPYELRRYEVSGAVVTSARMQWIKVDPT